jgi:3-methyladenine DNA glycosylase AlkC
MGAMNELINAAAVDGLRRHLGTASGEVLPAGAPEPKWRHLRAAAQGVDGLSLRARSDLVSAALIADLPPDYATVAVLFRRALDEPGFTGWMIWPVTETVTTLALAAEASESSRAEASDHSAADYSAPNQSAADHSAPNQSAADRAPFDDGLELLAELTPRLTGEFAIRRFLEADLNRALRIIQTWTTHPNEHVRRLASEGTRAFLPWAIRVRALLAHPESTTPILTALRSDESEYVRRSVANHLNDLGRQSPELATTLARSWMADADAHTQWVVRHGLRVLIKKAYPPALALLGFDEVSVTVSDPVLDVATVTMPGSLGFEFDVTNTGDTAARLAVDYLVYYVKANGTLSPKVFKLTTTTVPAGDTVRMRKRHAFHPMTTRVHYPGAHALELQINGQRYARTTFDLAEGASI